MSDRVCPQCGTVLPPIMRSHAVYCSRLCQGRHYNDAHRDELRRKGTDYRKSHRELLRERARSHNPKYYAAHKDEMRAYSAMWRKNNKALVCHYSWRRYHRVRGAGPLPSDRLLAIRYADQGGRCAYCRQEKPLELEHLFPVSKGGTNSLDNILYACRSCNASKGDKHPAAFTLLAAAAGLRP
jgi:5-methylcytosine-specific restriction endonuclease McrA